jgi:hypothetical protein
LVKPIKATMSKVVLITGGLWNRKAIGVFTSQGLYMELAETQNGVNSIFPLVTLDVRNSESIQAAVAKSSQAQAD